MIKTVRQTGDLRHLGGWHVALTSRADQHRRLQSNAPSCYRETQHFRDKAVSPFAQYRPFRLRQNTDAQAAALMVAYMAIGKKCADRC